MNYLVGVDYLFPESPGGMARVAWDIALAMRDRGHSVTLLCSDPPDGRRSIGHEHDGIRIARYTRPQLSALDPRRLEKNIAAVEDAARRQLGDVSWDIVHGHAPFIADGLRRALGDESRSVYTLHSPVVVEQQINWRKQGLAGRVKEALGLRALQRLERRVLEHCDAIQTLSAFCRNQIEEFHGLGEKVHVIPHWRRPGMRRTLSPSEARRRLGWPLEHKIILSVRIHGPRYGLDVAIRALAPLLLQDRCWFALGGDGPLRGALESLARSEGVFEKMRFTGRLSDEELALAYQAADLFLLPTLALEGFGLITIEALSYGCPVIGTDAGATPEILDSYQPGLVVPAGDVPALRAKVSDFLDGRLPVPSPKATAAFVEANYSAEAVLPRIFELLEGAAVHAA